MEQTDAAMLATLRHPELGGVCHAIKNELSVPCLMSFTATLITWPIQQTTESMCMLL